jgi:hypothetical protein
MNQETPSFVAASAGRRSRRAFVGAVGVGVGVLEEERASPSLSLSLDSFPSTF